MKKNILIIAIIIMFGCSNETSRVIIEKPENGKDGTSCSVTQTTNGALINCADGSSVFVENGRDGEKGDTGDQGAPGQNAQGQTITEVIDPCGDTGGFDELLLRLSSGELVAWLKDVGLVGLNDDQKYVTTDTQQCHFDVVGGDVVERGTLIKGSANNLNGVFSYSIVSGVSISSEIQHTCISGDSQDLDASKVRLRSAIPQQVEVQISGHNNTKVTVNVEPLVDTFVTFNRRGTVVAKFMTSNVTNTKACNN